jgi:tRNA 2-selenouridine synthase
VRKRGTARISRGRIEGFLLRYSTVVTLAQLAEFDEIIDVRSPSEFGDDHIPGALNCPVLDDAERAEIGTMYKQVSPFDARRKGAALVAKNIANHLMAQFASRDRKWKPLVYCWRGGKRSGAMVHVLRQVGWDAAQLDGGYKSYRREVISQLAALPLRYAYCIVCGETGSGKSRLLQALRDAGAQVLDLEGLARHRGSVLGTMPGESQPSQKAFESGLWRALTGLDPRRTVFVEAESMKIGDLRVPEGLMREMRASPCVRLDVPFARRVDLLLEDYQHFFGDRAGLDGKLDCLVGLHGRETVSGWKALAHNGNWAALVASLLESHYDPAYRRSTPKNYPRLAEALRVPCSLPDADGMRRAAGEIIKATGSARSPA